ncbi:MAG: ribonucleoside hydrolase [Acidimicrobiales bacterium]|nr:ribonucleoside hydrolase [Acidimicrobiales bacterium]
MTSGPRVILDCDPGIDDAFAIFCAVRFCNLVAVTSVSGNVPITHTTTNALHVLELAEASVPVFRGAAAPLVVEPFFADRIHGEAGLGAGATPPPQADAEPEPAASAICRLAAEGPLVIVAIGPLTNIAEAVQLDPELASRVDHLYWMGGSTTVGNVTEHAEFNAWADPHSIEVVMASGTPITMFGLNLTHQVRLQGTHVDRLRTAATQTSTPAAEFLAFYESHGSRDGRGQPMHDPCAVLGFTHPELFETEPGNTLVHLSGDTRGMTEMTDSPHAGTHRITVATKAAADDVIELIMTAVIDPQARS